MRQISYFLGKGQEASLYGVFKIQMSNLKATGPHLISEFHAIGSSYLEMFKGFCANRPTSSAVTSAFALNMSGCWLPVRA